MYVIRTDWNKKALIVLYKKGLKTRVYLTDYQYYTVVNPKSDLLITISLPQLLTLVYLTIQLLTLVYLTTCLHFLYFPRIYIEALELHSISSRSCNSSPHCKAYSTDRPSDDYELKKDHHISTL